MKCPICNRPIKPAAAWKGLSNRFYCSEFCAEAESAEPDAPFYPQPQSYTQQKARIDRQYLERLNRLLPYRRQSAQSLPLGWLSVSDGL